MNIVVAGKNGPKIIHLNRRRAIREKCLNCSGWDHKELTHCSHTDCKLHPFRTGNGVQNSADRIKAIRHYCLFCMNGQVGEVSKCPSIHCPLYIYRKGGVDKVTIGNNRKKNLFRNFSQSNDADQRKVYAGLRA